MAAKAIKVAGYGSKYDRETGKVKRFSVSAMTELPADWDDENDREDDVSSWDSAWDDLKDAAVAKHGKGAEISELWVVGR